MLCLRIVLGVGKEVIQFATAKGFDHAVVDPPFGMVKVGADQAGQFPKAGLVNRRPLVRQILALAPIGQRVCVIEAVCTLPELVVVQEGDHCPLVMVGQRCEIFDESCARFGVGRQVPLCLIDDSRNAASISFR
jgi:hypothetical protein